MKKWRNDILEVINRDNACSKLDTKPDIKKKDTKPDTKKKDKPDTKPETKKKDKPDTKPETKKKDKPDTNKKDKLDTKKKDKLDTKEKDRPILKTKINQLLKRKINEILKRKRLDTKKKDKPDTKLDIKKHKEISKNMIVMHKRMLLPLKTLLLDLIKYTHWGYNFDLFYDLCEESRVKIDAKTEGLIVDAYSINVALDRMRDGLKCKTWPKCVGISRIRKLDKASVRDYYKE